ncbi:MAG TPA: DUF418 domain-containing protein, partial [Chthoniobacterales bacterium]|nr:DUF418 domain-containing protein [Chthoniobacterales bacterium]
MELKATGTVNSETVNEELAGPPPAPVAAGARLASLDVLRGFALLGILMANIQDFASPTGILHDIPLDVVSQTGPHHSLDFAVMTVQWLFIEGKMRALFGLLFGAGTVLLLERLEKRSGAKLAADIFHRRSMWLLLFGILHGSLIWSSDILLFYGSLALLALYPLRDIGARYLIGIGLALSLAGGTLGIANAMDLRAALPAAALQEAAAAARASHTAPTAAQEQAVEAAVALRTQELQAIPKAVTAGRQGYLASEPDNAKEEADFVALVFRTGWVFEVLGIMIAGMGVYKTGFLSARLPSGVYLGTAVCGYAISIPIVLVGIQHARRFGFSDAVTTIDMFLPYGIQQIAGMLANASVVLLLVRNRTFVPLQQALAAVGRTALTNYLFTSVVCQFLFKWGPWKLYGAFEYYQQIYVVLCV